MECVDGPQRILCKHLRDDPDASVRVKRDVDVRWRDEVDRRRVAHRAADRDRNRPGASRKEPEGRGRHRARHVLHVAEEAPRPLPSSDASGRDPGELRREVVSPRGHQVDIRRPLAQPERPRSRSSWPTSPTCSPPQPHPKTTRYTAGCAGPGSRSISRNEDRRTFLLAPAVGHGSRNVPVRASTPAMDKV